MHAHTYTNEELYSKQRASVDNVNILLISSAFEVLSGPALLTNGSVSAAQTPNPTNPWWRGDTGLPLKRAGRTNAILIIQRAIR